MPGRGQYLALADIARLTGVGISAVSNWRKRHADFPRPVIDSGRELFAASEVVNWLGHRKIARNGLQPGEAPGTTYAARFIRNGEAFALLAAPEPSHVQADTRSDWKDQLWRILNLLRIDLEFMAAVDLTLAMLHLSITDPNRWRDVVRQSSWAAVRRATQDLRLPSQDLALFSANPSDAGSEQRLLEAMQALRRDRS